MKHPAAVTACNVDLENLITDSNRSIATLAITTLLKVSICRQYWARMHEAVVSASPGQKLTRAGLECKVGMHDDVVALVRAEARS